MTAHTDVLNLEHVPSLVDKRVKYVGNAPLQSETHKDQEVHGRQKLLWKPIEQKRYDDLIKSNKLSIEALMRIRGNSDAAIGNKFLTVLPPRGLERLTLDNQSFRVACLSLLGVPLGKGEGVSILGKEWKNRFWQQQDRCGEPKLFAARAP